MNARGGNEIEVLHGIVMGSHHETAVKRHCVYAGYVKGIQRMGVKRENEMDGYAKTKRYSSCCAHESYGIQNDVYDAHEKKLRTR
jgi:hypothetical protein